MGPTSLLALFPELEREMDPDHLELARRALRVRTWKLERGHWITDGLEQQGLGFLITKGFLARRVDLGKARSFEPLGPGDIVCPWQEDAVSFARSRFEVIKDAEIVDLTDELVSRAARFKGILPALFERGVRRSRYMAVFGAIDGVVGVEDRLNLLFWGLAERWGEFRDGHVYLPVAFHHEALAQLIAARRPSVSTALSRLQDAGELRRVEDGWFLFGSPPEPPPG
jgi:hypothetical protein